MVFVDGVAAEYPRYLDEAVRLLRPGGVLALDDMLCGARVGEEVADARRTRRPRPAGGGPAGARRRAPGSGVAPARRGAAGGGQDRLTGRRDRKRARCAGTRTGRAGRDRAASGWRRPPSALRTGAAARPGPGRGHRGRRTGPVGARRAGGAAVSSRTAGAGAGAAGTDVHRRCRIGVRRRPRARRRPRPATAEPDLPTAFFPEEDPPAAGDLVAEGIRFPPGCWVAEEAGLGDRWALDGSGCTEAWAFSFAAGPPGRGERHRGRPAGHRRDRHRELVGVASPPRLRRPRRRRRPDRPARRAQPRARHRHGERRVSPETPTRRRLGAARRRTCRSGRSRASSGHPGLGRPGDRLGGRPRRARHHDEPRRHPGRGAAARPAAGRRGRRHRARGRRATACAPSSGPPVTTSASRSPARTPATGSGGAPAAAPPSTSPRRRRTCSRRRGGPARRRAGSGHELRGRADRRRGRAVARPPRPGRTSSRRPGRAARRCRRCSAGCCGPPRAGRAGWDSVEMGAGIVDAARCSARRPRPRPRPRVGAPPVDPLAGRGFTVAGWSPRRSARRRRWTRSWTGTGSAPRSRWRCWARCAPARGRTRRRRGGRCRRSSPRASPTPTCAVGSASPTSRSGRRGVSRAVRARSCPCRAPRPRPR